MSGLSFISKLVERVVASQLSKHVSLHGLENENQSAYRRGHSTETALLSIKMLDQRNIDVKIKLLNV